jgi:hypothetical protein
VVGPEDGREVWDSPSVVSASIVPGPLLTAGVIGGGSMNEAGRDVVPLAVRGLNKEERRFRTWLSDGLAG